MTSHVHTSVFSSSTSGLITYKPGPYCVDHRSDKCEHALSAIDTRDDVPHIAEMIEDDKSVGLGFSLSVPLWPNFYIWEDLKYKVQTDDTIGNYAILEPPATGKHPEFHAGIKRVLPGEGARDVANVLLQQFEDLLELDWPSGQFAKGCRSRNHTMKYQQEIEKVANAGSSGPMAPHLYALRSRAMCAFCWADMYGSEARRVAGSNAAIAAADMTDDFEDLLPDDSMGGRRRSSFAPELKAAGPDYETAYLPF